MSLVLVVGTPSLSACRSNKASDEPGQEVVVKDSDAPKQEATSQGAWLLAKKVETYTYEDSESQATSIYERDEHGNLVKLTESDGADYTSTTTYTVDANGIMTAKAVESSYGESSETTYTCQIDEAGRPVRYEAADGSETDEYTYDADGNRTKAVLTRVFTNYDEETGESGKETRVITYTYDADGNVTSYRNVGEGYANASETTYERDESGKVVKATQTDWSEDGEGNAFEDSKTTTVITYTYDDAGNIAQANYESDAMSWTVSYEWESFEEASAAAVADGHIRQ